VFEETANCRNNLMIMDRNNYDIDGNF